MPNEPAHLFAPLTIKSVTLRNRIGLSPMCQYSSQDGAATDWHLMHLGARAVGGAGLVIPEGTAVSPAGRITPEDAGLWADRHSEPLIRINRFVQDQGTVPGVQLTHAGGKTAEARPWEGGAHLADAHGGWPTLAPSALAFGADLPNLPQAMSEADIARVQGDFVAGSQRALAAGYEWPEVHAAHGYLLHQFLIAAAQRAHGTLWRPLENRVRCLIEIAGAARAVWPERLPLAVRVFCSNWVDGGWDIAQSVALARLLKAEGVDLIDCSSGDLVLLARELLRDAQWPLQAAQTLGQSAVLEAPMQYQRAR